MLCPSTVRIRVLKRLGGDAPSPVETRAIYIFIYWGGGGRVEGEPAWWPSFAEIKSMSLRLGKSNTRVPVCERRPQVGVSGRRWESRRGRQVHTDPAPRPNATAQRRPLAGAPGVPANPTGRVVFFLGWDPREARGSPDGATSTTEPVTR